MQLSQLTFIINFSKIRRESWIPDRYITYVGSSIIDFVNGTEKLYKSTVTNEDIFASDWEIIAEEKDFLPENLNGEEKIQD